MDIPDDIAKKAEELVRKDTCSVGVCTFMHGCGCFQAIAAALLAERNRTIEECAGIADDHDTGKSRNDWDAGANCRAGTIAAVIRALLK